MTRKPFPLSKVYTLLESGPVILLTTVREGRPNIMTLSWHTMIDFDPPLLGVVVSNRNYTFETLMATKECVINIPSAALGKKVVGCGNVSGRDADKFKMFRLTPEPARCVTAPLIKQCFASIECKVTDTRMAAQYDLFILEGVQAWADPLRKYPRTLHHRGKDVFMVSGKTICLPSSKK